MSMISVKEALALPDGGAIAQLQAFVDRVYRSTPTASGKIKQDASLKDRTGAVMKATFWGRDDLAQYEGKDIVISAGPKGGLKVKFDTYQQRNVNTLSASETTNIVIVGHSAPVGVAPAAPLPPAASHGSGMISGQTVGMAIKVASDIVCSRPPAGTASPESVTDIGNRIYAMASEIVRIAKKLEAGELSS